MALPWASVMVIMVLLKVALTCATPEEMFLRSRRRRRGLVSLAMGLLLHLLLAGDRPCRPLAGAGIGVGALAADRQAAAVTQTPIATEIHQPLDVHRDIAPQVALDAVVAVDGLAQAADVGIGQLVDPPAELDPDRRQDLARAGRANAVDIGQGNPDRLAARDVHSGDTRHAKLSSCFCPVRPDQPIRT